MKLPTLLALFLAAAASAAEFGPDSIRQKGVPVGKVTRHDLRSEVFPGTLRQFYIYTPAQYQEGEAAAVMVFQDGHAYVDEGGEMRVPIVFDNLIHQGAMPVTIGVFINPGLNTEKMEGQQDWDTLKAKSNRSVEYDSLNGKYAEMLEKEILPLLEKDFTLTDDPERRAICGLSSGGICAFTVAWERPDLFRKVLSHIGSFTNIRGGHVYPALIRKGEKRPLRVYLQDGANDLDNKHGNWFLSNQQMAKALEFRDYDYKFVPTEGKHSGEDGGKILPEALRWLWRK